MAGIMMPIVERGTATGTRGVWIVSPCPSCRVVWIRVFPTTDQVAENANPDIVGAWSTCRSVPNSI